MSVDRLRDRRPIRVTEPLLTQFLRCSETAHQRCVCVTESVKAIAPRHLDIQRHEQRPELSLERQVLIPRRPVPRGEKQPQLVGVPWCQRCGSSPFSSASVSYKNCGCSHRCRRVRRKYPGPYPLHAYRRAWAFRQSSLRLRWDNFEVVLVKLSQSFLDRNLDYLLRKKE